MRLEAGSAVLELAPEVGGSVAGWTWHGRPVMRPVTAEDRAAHSPRRLCAFPLIPFSGRIADGRFRWQGREVQLPPNFPPEPHAIHGNAWERAWSVEGSGTDRALLALDHRGDASWPFPYRAEQRFTLRPDGMELRIGVRNTGGAPMPAGLGWHPHFPRGADAALGFHADRVWLADARNLPERLAPPAGDYLFDPMRPLGDAQVDNCYAGWDGRATFRPAGLQVTLTADPVFGHFVVYTPQGRPYFCAEPATHAPDAINRPEGMRALAPGEELAGTIRLDLAGFP